MQRYYNETRNAYYNDPQTARSFRVANNRDGIDDRRPGTASPRKTCALARCTQHESTVYQRRVSSDGSNSKNSAFFRANV